MNTGLKVSSYSHCWETLRQLQGIRRLAAQLSLDTTLLDFYVIRSGGRECIGMLADLRRVTRDVSSIIDTVNGIRGVVRRMLRTEVGLLGGSGIGEEGMRPSGSEDGSEECGITHLICKDCLHEVIEEEAGEGLFRVKFGGGG